MMHPQTHEAETLNFRDYITAARRWWWLLLLVPLLSAGVAYWFTSRQPRVYTASATLYVAAPSTTSNDITAARLSTKSYGRLVTSRLVLERVLEKLKLDRSVAELEANISTSVPVDTQIIQVTAQDSDPQVAADLANATGEAFAASLGELQPATSLASAEAVQQTLSQAQADIENLNVQLAQLRGIQNPTAEEASNIIVFESRLRQRQNEYDVVLQLQQSRAFAPQGSVQVTDPADVPSVTGNLVALRDAALAGLLGLALAAIGSILYERVTNRIHRPDDVYRKVGVPALGGIPHFRKRGKLATITAPYAATSEAIRSLRTRLHFATNGRGIGTLVITSPQASAGKSLIAANLATVIAQSGQRVVLVDADLRAPQQHQLFGVQNKEGFAKLLAYPAARSEYMLVRHPHIEGLMLLVAGAPHASSADLLASKRLHLVVAELRRMADVVIIDAPPLSAFSDALLLAAEADHVLLTAESGRTRAEVLRSALSSVQQTGAMVLGVVVYGAGMRSFGTQVAPQHVKERTVSANHQTHDATTKLNPEAEYDRV